MRFDVFTIIPEVMEPYLQIGVIGRARQAALIDVRLHNLRDYTSDRHRTTDDEAYGTSGGMVMKPEPVFAAVEAILGENPGEVPIILLSPQGRVFTQFVARELVKHPRLALICGRYEGMDERVREHLATDEISIGDYVLSGGELPGLVVIDAVARLIPGVLGDAQAPQDDSHAAGLLEGPQYTRPADFRGWKVPPVLLSGDHARIASWRRQQALRHTLRKRPDLLQRAELSDEDRRLLKLMEYEADEDHN